MNTKERLPELDILRLGAALSVALYHVCRWPSTGQLITDIAQLGFLGVNVFFVISGFVILMTAEQRTPVEFAKSRIARLFPTFWICVLVTSAALAAHGQPPSLATVAANLTMVPPLFHKPFIDLVYWTLVVELRFYCMVLLLLVFRQMVRLELWLALWVGALVAVRVQVTPWLTHGWHALQWLSLAPFGVLFASGCYLYLIRTRGASWRYLVPLTLCAGLAIYDACTLRDGSTYPWTHADLWAMAALVMLAYALFVTLSLRVWRLLPSSAWYWLGGLTYPLYLLHAQAGRMLWEALPGSEWARSVLVLVASIAMAALLAHYSERRACKALHRGLDVLDDRIRRRFGTPRTGAQTELDSTPSQSPRMSVPERVIK
jgi:peptidoglycan/LPS O-acetylase OafA/YrhL